MGCTTYYPELKIKCKGTSLWSILKNLHLKWFDHLYSIKLYKIVHCKAFLCKFPEKWDQGYSEHIIRIFICCQAVIFRNTSELLLLSCKSVIFQNILRGRIKNVLILIYHAPNTLTWFKSIGNTRTVKTIDSPVNYLTQLSSHTESRNATKINISQPNMEKQ